MRQTAKIKCQIRNLAYRSNAVVLLHIVREIKALLSQKSFSQFQEDEIISRLLRGEKGYYLDIGSGRPISGSNTYALYKLGWTGTAIDPLKNNARLFKIFRPRDRFLNVVVGASSPEVEFYEFEQYVYSTFYRRVAEAAILQNNARIRRVTRVRNYILDEKDLNGLNSSSSLLSIDCEGADYAVLQTIDFVKYRPSVICVELFRKNSINVDEKISGYLKLNRYCLFSSTYLNGVFVSEEFIEKSQTWGNGIEK